MTQNSEHEKMQEVAGLQTAVEQMDALLKRFAPTIEHAANVEKHITDERARLTEKMAKDKDFAAVVSLVGGIEAMVQKNAEASRKAVTEDVKAFQIQVQAINVHLANANTKYGNPIVTEKKRARAGTGHGTMNTQNVALATDELVKRGYQNIEAVPIMNETGQPSGFFELRGVSSTGQFRKGRYYEQILKDWN